MAPFVGSVVLFGLYVLFRFFHKDYINLLLSTYFVLFGILALATTIRPIFERLLPKMVRKNNPYVISAPKLLNRFLCMYSASSQNLNEPNPFAAEPWEIKFDGVDILSPISLPLLFN